MNIPRARECMTSAVASCGPEADMERAAHLMWTNDCGVIPVVNDRAHVVGVVTDRDLVMAAYTKGRALRDVRVADCMSRDVATCSPNESIEDVMRAAKKDPDRPQNVMTVHFVGGDPAIVEIQAPRGRGMAYRLARQLSAHGINILSARVGQWAGSGTAAFYVTSSDGSVVDAAMVGRALESQKV